MNERFDRVDLELRTQRTELGGRIDGLHERMDALQRTIIHVGFAQVIALVGTLITALLTRA